MRYGYAYDAMGRLTEKKASGRTLLAFEYDLNGNLTKQTDVTGKITEYDYDILDRIREVRDNGTTMAQYVYHPDDSVKSLQNGSLYTEYVYDADRNLTSLRTLLGTDVIVNNRYTYDGNGNRLEKLQKHGVTTYGYDSMKRLVKAEYPDATEELFYDKAGNRTKRLYNGAEEQYRYDKCNRLTAHTKGGVTTQYEYDNAGNLLKDARAEYEYDAFNRNTKAETFDGNIQINRYDAEGLRHEMEENGKLVTFIFRGNEAVTEETDGNIIRHIRGYDLIASDAENARTYYHYASDEMSSITHVAEGTQVLNHYEYDAWGNLTACEEKVQNRFKFNGQQYDSVTQQYYLRARYYNPVIGRFTQEDTYNADGLNLYAYCRNNPVYYVDPSGNICEKRANEIMDKLNSGGDLSNSEKKKLAAYLRNKERRTDGGLTDAESRMLDQVDRKRNKNNSSKTAAETEARRIMGPYYDEVLKRHEETPDYYAHPNEYRIVEGDEYDRVRAEYTQMVNQGELEPGHHILGVADGGQNVQSNITYTGEKFIDRSMLPKSALDYYDSTYARSDNPHPKRIAIYEQDGNVNFGKNPLHTEATTLQQNIHNWQKEQGYRRK